MVNKKQKEKNMLKLILITLIFTVIFKITGVIANMSIKFIDLIYYKIIAK